LETSGQAPRWTSPWARARLDLPGSEGLAIARANAGKPGVKIRTVLSGYQEFDFGQSRWDLIAMIYAFVPIRDAAFITRVTDSLRPGGALVFEHYIYTGDPAQREAAEMIGQAGPDELPTIFSGVRILRYDESTAIPDWGARRPAPIVRLLARKMK
jgi:hypothetical protein